MFGNQELRGNRPLRSMFPAIRRQQNSDNVLSIAMAVKIAGKSHETSRYTYEEKVCGKVEVRKTNRCFVKQLLCL